MLYINAYLLHLKTRSNSTFYATLLWALIGIYIKDIAILLFIIPPASIWAANTINIRRKARHFSHYLPSFNRGQPLEHWLCSLSIVFITSYIILALIPSSYASEGAYNANAAFNIVLDLRFYLFALISTVRVIGIAKKKTHFHFLDAINISGFAYAFALAATYELNTSSYLSLPFQLIATINIAWAWIAIVEKGSNQNIRERKKNIGAALASAIVIGVDHGTAKNTFINNISEQKFEYSYVQLTHKKLDEVSRTIRESVDNVNIIINTNSRLSAHRHWNRIPYTF